jgi:hypothetical protein
MWDSKIKIEGGHNEDVWVSMLEARNLVVLKVENIKFISTSWKVENQFTFSYNFYVPDFNF